MREQDYAVNNSSSIREIGRVVECTGLENRRTLIAYPGFESLVSRHITSTEPAFWRALLFLGFEKSLCAEAIVSASFGIVSATRVVLEPRFGFLQPRV